MKNLEDMLTIKVVPVTRGEVFTKRLGIKEAVRSRDAAIKSLYEVLYTLLEAEYRSGACTR